MTDCRLVRFFVLVFAGMGLAVVTATAQPAVVLGADTVCPAAGFAACAREVHPHPMPQAVSLYQWSGAETPLVTVWPGEALRLIAPGAGPLGDTMFVKLVDYGPLEQEFQYDLCSAGGRDWRLVFYDGEGVERLSASHSCEGVLSIVSAETTMLLPFPMQEFPESDVPTPGIPSGGPGGRE